MMNKEKKQTETTENTIDITFDRKVQLRDTIYMSWETYKVSPQDYKILKTYSVAPRKE